MFKIETFPLMFSCIGLEFHFLFVSTKSIWNGSMQTILHNWVPDAFYFEANVSSLSMILSPSKASTVLFDILKCPFTLIDLPNAKLL